MKRLLFFLLFVLLGCQQPIGQITAAFEQYQGYCVTNTQPQEKLLQLPAVQIGQPLTIRFNHFLCEQKACQKKVFLDNIMFLDAAKKCVGENCPLCEDTDGDGYRANQERCKREQQHDCNDQDATVKPGAQEVCDQKDNDCDGTTDEEGVCTQIQPTEECNGQDDDGDGKTDEAEDNPCHDMALECVAGQCREPSVACADPEDCPFGECENGQCVG